MTRVLLESFQCAEDALEDPALMCAEAGEIGAEPIEVGTQADNGVFNVSQALLDPIELIEPLFNSRYSTLQFGNAIECWRFVLTFGQHSTFSVGACRNDGCGRVWSTG